MKKIIWFCSSIMIATLLIFTNGCKKDKENSSNNPTPFATVTDIDGNIYHTVTIGTQTWTVENLKVIKYRNGDSIPKVKEDTTWGNLTTGSYCIYNNDIINVTTYGRLYNWYAVNDNRNIAPIGWHIPSQSEWTVLAEYIGGIGEAGGILKEAGTSHWTIPNTGASNSVGFRALPGGYRNKNGVFCEIKFDGTWWSSTEVFGNSSYYINLNYYYKSFAVNGDSKLMGLSVRCVKD